jgi:hypothetical protein
MDKNDQQSYIVSRHDPTEIIQLRDSAALSEFLKDPRSVIAGALIEGFSHGPSALTQPLIRVGVAALTGRALEQFAQEIKGFREKGKIPDDWAEKSKGYQTWVELLRVIDEESPDEERLDAMKAMFFAVNSISSVDAERIIAYQLFQIAKRLNSNELLVLKGIYENRGKFGSGILDFAGWAKMVADYLGHRIAALIEHADKGLTENQLLSGRIGSDGSGVQRQNGRLTDLGIKFCENLERYQVDKKA